MTTGQYNGSINYVQGIGGTNGSGSSSNTFAVTVATTTNIDIASAPAIIDTITLIDGNTILVKNQTPDTGNGNPNNGLYLFNGANNPLTYLASFNTWNAYVGLLVSVSLGSQTGTSWTSNATTGGILDTTSLGFASSATGNVTVTGGLTKTGNNLTLKTVTAPTNQFSNGVDINGNIIYAQVSAGQVSGLAPSATTDTTNADNISSGTLADARLSTDVTKQGNTFNGNSQLVQLNSSGQIPAIDSSLTTIGGSFIPINSSVLANDSINTAFEKVQGQLNNIEPLTQWNLGIPKYPTTNYNVLTTDTVIITQAIDLTISLYAISGVTDSTPVVIKDGGRGGTIVTTSDSSLIDGKTSITLNALDCLTVFPTSTNWAILSELLNSTPPPTANVTAYTVTSPAYSDNGILLIANPLWSGFLLGNSGSAFIVSLQQPTPVTQTQQYLYVNAIGGVYPTTGMLVLSQTATTGDLGLLIGDDGKLYNIPYDNTQFPTIQDSVQNVPAIDTRPAGITLAKQGASSGSAGLLFGSDSKLYNFTIN